MTASRIEGPLPTPRRPCISKSTGLVTKLGPTILSPVEDGARDSELQGRVERLGQLIGTRRRSGVGAKPSLRRDSLKVS